MFDIGASELLVIIIVAVVVIGPKEMPRALRTAGRWIGKMRRLSSHVRTGIDAMVREAELEDAEKEWQARNARIMSEQSGPAMEEIPKAAAKSDPEDVRADAARERARPSRDLASSDESEPALPFEPEDRLASPKD